MITVDYPKILETIREYLVPKRTESASFLAWYFGNYYRLDDVEAIDSICDQKGDKGVDGIYVNENENRIEIFQVKISQDSNASIGDTALKEFYGTLSQFKDIESIENIIATGGYADVVKLIKRLELVKKCRDMSVRGFFLSNIELDSNGKAFLKQTPNITFIGKHHLLSTYISAERKSIVSKKASGFSIAQYYADANTLALIAPIKAAELVKLEGIMDQSLFAFNVRGPLGRTQVNRDIVASIRSKDTHKQFPLFHNGITILAQDLHLQAPKYKIEIQNYYVVNGCQSLSSLYEYRSAITEDLRILTKFIKVSPDSPLAATITRYSNNQNGVKARDFKSNDAIQIRLQNEFEKHYKNKFSYEIKRGESEGTGDVISNEVAGLYLIAFDLKEPWSTHRKYQVFEEKYTDLFARPEVTAHRIVFLHLLMKSIRATIPNIENKLFGTYTLTQYLLLYILRCILENDKDMGIKALRGPEIFIKDAASISHLKKCIENILGDVVIDINAEVEPLGDDFDYRDKLRDATWVPDLAKKVYTNYLKMVARKRITSFSQEWSKIEQGERT